MSVEIGGRMNLSEQTEKDMNNMRKKYLPVSDKVCLSTSCCPMLKSHFLTLTSRKYYVPFTIFCVNIHSWNMYLAVLVTSFYALLVLGPIVLHIYQQLKWIHNKMKKNLEIFSEHN